MSASCVACRIRGSGMVAIFKHPNGLDQMFTSVTGVEVEDEDHLCIPCYDDLKAAHLFKQKAIQNNILRISRPTASTRSGDSNRTSRPDVDHKENVLITENSTNPSEEQTSNVEITTTSATEADIFEEHLIIRSDDDDDDEEEEDSEMQEESEVLEVKIDLAELQSTAELDQPTSSAAPEQPVNIGSDVKVVQQFKLEPIRCDECGKSFSKTTLLQKHMRSCHQSESTDDNEQLGPGALASLPTVHNLMCEYCFQEFSILKEKYEHETVHATETKPYKCPQCDGTFKDKVGLRSHIRIHSAVKRFKCQYCEMRFHQRGNLTAHERTHVGSKPYLCPQCGKGFAESGNLKNHIRYHTGERPYACSECPKRFRTHYSRTVHFRSHNNDRPFRCTECDKCFYSSGKLIIHRRVHSGEKPYKCGTCPAKFADSSGLRRHSKTH
ncbi:zinc finger and SCAN domain-containing protein 2 [Wyeomyia smithii]|uniref:zinc finger and SCAN domain-containing protein 2 n=1 Tax=Wyeomyia smithii TaxID=174621 RepID=UPI0024680694|nr:zinc finger and SCAN domain-containing protein 2 [Wyeomyia smithii]